MSYCGTCKTDPCLVDSHRICCHDVVRWGYCSGHVDLSESQQYQDFASMVDAEYEKTYGAEERRIAEWFDTMFPSPRHVRREPRTDRPQRLHPEE